MPGGKWRRTGKGGAVRGRVVAPERPEARKSSYVGLNDAAPRELGPREPRRSLPCDGFMAWYKTEWCPYRCRHEWQSCPYAHTYQDFRRSPTMQYGSKPCPRWDRNDRLLAYEDRCELGFACPYAHGSKEQLYHPSYYKTHPCTDLTTHGFCPRGQGCAFYHHDYDRRDVLGDEDDADYSRPLEVVDERITQPPPRYPAPGTERRDFHVDPREEYGMGARVHRVEAFDLPWEQPRLVDDSADWQLRLLLLEQAWTQQLPPPGVDLPGLGLGRPLQVPDPFMGSGVMVPQLTLGGPEPPRQEEEPLSPLFGSRTPLAPTPRSAEKGGHYDVDGFDVSTKNTFLVVSPELRSARRRCRSCDASSRFFEEREIQLEQKLQGRHCRNASEATTVIADPWVDESLPHSKVPVAADGSQARVHSSDGSLASGSVYGGETDRE